MDRLTYSCPVRRLLTDTVEGFIDDDAFSRDAAVATQAVIRNASDRMSGLVATRVGVVTILVAASGVFGGVQSALNAIWRAKSRRSTMSRPLRARLASFGLVITLGFVLMVSLALSAALTDTVLFEGGKYLIALYIGQTGVASSFGAAGALIVLLLWIFYSSLIFLLGAEFTRAWTHVYGLMAGQPGNTRGECSPATGRA